MLVIFTAAAMAACNGLAPARNLRASSSPRSASAVTPSMIALPKVNLPIPRAANPFDWSVDRPEGYYKVPGQALYRQIGVAPEADFDEIKEAVKRLSEEALAEGEPKKKIKLEIAQDKIMELRLRQASAGKLQMSGEALYKNNMIEERDAALAKRNKRLKVPKWTKGLVQYPTKKYAKECSKLIAIFAVFGGVVNPGVATPCTAFIVFSAMNNLYKRNRPKQFVEEGMPGVRT